MDIGDKYKNFNELNGLFTYIVKGKKKRHYYNELNFSSILASAKLQNKF